MADGRDMLSLVLNRRELVVRSEADDLKYLRHHWADVYIILRPSDKSSLWKALAKFGDRDELLAEDAEELLYLIRKHYGPSTSGYQEVFNGKVIS